MSQDVTFYKQIGVSCPDCKQRSGYPITNDWWYEHTGVWHLIKWWFKRRLNSAK